MFYNKCNTWEITLRLNNLEKKVILIVLSHFQIPCELLHLRGWWFYVFLILMRQKYIKNPKESRIFLQTIKKKTLECLRDVQSKTSLLQKCIKLVFSHISGQKYYTLCDLTIAVGHFLYLSFEKLALICTLTHRPIHRPLVFTQFYSGLVWADR